MSEVTYYLATPYSRYYRGNEEAFVEACKASAELIRRGMHIYSPIAHSHPIAEHGKIDNLDYKIWLSLSLVMLKQCDSLIVLKMPGWDESHGVSEEIKHAEKWAKPIIYMNWPLMRM